jgi:tRNA C32,U32 (ribose-2'-O)-methylase TrmJ
MKIKLAANADRFPTPQHELSYAISRLGGTALAQLIPFVEGAVINLADMNAFYTILEDAFGDPDRYGHQIRELEDLKQNNREFSLYYADFQRLIAGVDWNDPAKRHALTRGLSRELKRALVFKTERADFHGYVRQLQALDERIRANAAEERKSTSSF